MPSLTDLTPAIGPRAFPHTQGPDETFTLESGRVLYRRKSKLLLLPREEDWQHFPRVSFDVVLPVPVCWVTLQLGLCMPPITGTRPCAV